MCVHLSNICFIVFINLNAFLHFYYLFMLCTFYLLYCFTYNFKDIQQQSIFKQCIYISNCASSQSDPCLHCSSTIHNKSFHKPESMAYQVDLYSTTLVIIAPNLVNVTSYTKFIPRPLFLSSALTVSSHRLNNIDYSERRVFAPYKTILILFC